MTLYKNFIGIDIGKSNFVVSIYGSNKIVEYDNSISGISLFLKEHLAILPDSLSILEATGGYELELLYSLLSCKYDVHRANTRKVKNFIRSFGSSAKTDALDAKALALYGSDRHTTLDLFKAKSDDLIELFQLVQRRNDLKITLVAEKNRLAAPGGNLVKDSIVSLTSMLLEQIKLITDKIKLIIQNNPDLNEKQNILKTIPGIGDIVAFELLVLLPELGRLSRRKIASLAGLAPIANDSGKYKGYRRTGHGRNGVKPILFLAAMAARSSKTYLKEFYEKLISKGKKKMVALTALMRKLLVIANAKIKDLLSLKHS